MFHLQIWPVMVDNDVENETRKYIEIGFYVIYYIFAFPQFSTTPYHIGKVMTTRDAVKSCKIMIYKEQRVWWVIQGITHEGWNWSTVL